MPPKAMPTAMPTAMPEARARAVAACLEAVGGALPRAPAMAVAAVMAAVLLEEGMEVVAVATAPAAMGTVVGLDQVREVVARVAVVMVPVRLTSVARESARKEAGVAMVRAAGVPISTIRRPGSPTGCSWKPPGTCSRSPRRSSSSQGKACWRPERSCWPSSPCNPQ